jgi:hypothetical protein
MAGQAGLEAPRVVAVGTVAKDGRADAIGAAVSYNMRHNVRIAVERRRRARPVSRRDDPTPDNSRRLVVPVLVAAHGPGGWPVIEAIIRGAVGGRATASVVIPQGWVRVNERERAPARPIDPRSSSSAGAPCGQVTRKVCRMPRPADALPGRSPPRWRPARQRRAAAVGSPSRHRSPRRRRRSALAGARPARRPPRPDPGAARQPVQHLGEGLVAPQWRAGPTGTTRVDTHGAAPVERHQQHARWQPPQLAGRFVLAVSPRCGRILGGSACRCSFTPRSSAGQASQRSKNQTGMWTTGAADEAFLLAGLPIVLMSMGLGR